MLGAIARGPCPQCAIPLGPFESVVDLTEAKPAPALLTSLAATDAALARYKQDLIGSDFAYDVVAATGGGIP